MTQTLGLCDMPGCFSAGDTLGITHLAFMA